MSCEPKVNDPNVHELQKLRRRFMLKITKLPHKTGKIVRNVTNDNVIIIILHKQGIRYHK